MTATPPQTHHQSGSSAVELVGLVAAAVALLTAVVPVLASRGDGQARAVVRVVDLAIASPGELVHAGGSVEHVHQIGQVAHEVARRAPRPIDANGLRMHPLLPTVAVRSASTSWRDGVGGVRHGGSARGCLLCAGVEARAGTTVGARTSGTGSARTSGLGVAADARAHAWLALVHGELTDSLAAGSVTTGAQLHTRATLDVGGDLLGRGTLTLGTAEQSLRLHGSAVAGARVRAEQRLSGTLLGIGAQETAGVEGWAGLGATGEVHVEHAGGRFTVGGRLGGAIGLGGAVDVSATVDTSRLLHGGDVAAGAVGAALEATVPAGAVAGQALHVAWSALTDHHHHHGRSLCDVSPFC